MPEVVRKETRKTIILVPQINQNRKTANICVASNPNLCLVQTLLRKLFCG